MLNGERINAIPEAAATAVATNLAVPIDQLRAELARICKRVALAAIWRSLNCLDCLEPWLPLPVRLARE